MLRIALSAAGIAVSMAGPAVAVSPTWCSSDALNESERIICVDSILSRLDIELSQTFAAARHVAPDLDQASWLAERNSCGEDVSCLERTYRSRIAELGEIATRLGDEIEEERGRDFGHNGQIEVSALGDSGQASDGVVTALGSALGGLVSRNLMPALDRMTPRPWCEARSLNLTEGTICADADLSRLDALLELVYGGANARDDDRAQNVWLRSERDACGAERLCIANSYAARIEQLDNAGAVAQQPSRVLDIPAGHHPAPGTCRVWYPDLPPGQQPPPSSCDVFVPDGAILIEGE